MNARSIARRAAPQVAPVPDRLPTVALVALAFSTFISVTIEMLPTGLMHLMAPDLGVSHAAIGLLMTVFAFTVVLTSTPVTHLTRALPRHALLVGVLAVFALGSIGTAIAPSYELVVATRIATGLAHGLFWAVVAAYVALISPPRLLTKAVSITLGGGSAAYVLGVPIGTLLGQLFGWRLAFGLLSALALAVAALLWMLLPRVDHRAAGQPGAGERALELQPAPTGPIAIATEAALAGRGDAEGPGGVADAEARRTTPGAPDGAVERAAAEGPSGATTRAPRASDDGDASDRDEAAADAATAAVTAAAADAADAATVTVTANDAPAPAIETDDAGRPRSLARVVALCLLTGVIMLAQYAAYSYISPYIIEIIGMPEATLSLLLFGYGVASAVATLLTGLFFNTRRGAGFVVAFGLMLAAVGTLAASPPAWLALAAVVVWGFGMGFMPPLLQTTLLTVAPARIRDVSSALYTSGFNLGIGGGALVGGVIVDALGLGALMPFFLVVVTGAFVAWAVVMARRR